MKGVNNFPVFVLFGFRFLIVNKKNARQILHGKKK